MKPQSKLLLAAGILVSTATCSGQRPLFQKSMMHFAAEIIRVDSILSGSSYYKQIISNISLRNSEYYKDSIHFEIIRDETKQKRGSGCPMSIEMGPPKKI